MRHVSTHTFVVLEVSHAAYDEIKGKLEAAGYDVMVKEKADGSELLDMHGLALSRRSWPRRRSSSHVTKKRQA